MSMIHLSIKWIYKHKNVKTVIHFFKRNLTFNANDFKSEIDSESSVRVFNEFFIWMFSKPFSELLKKLLYNFKLFSRIDLWVYGYLWVYKLVIPFRILPPVCFIHVKWVKSKPCAECKYLKLNTVMETNWIWKIRLLLLSSLYLNLNSYFDMIDSV